MSRRSCRVPTSLSRRAEHREGLWRVLHGKEQVGKRRKGPGVSKVENPFRAALILAMGDTEGYVHYCIRAWNGPSSFESS